MEAVWTKGTISGWQRHMKLDKKRRKQRDTHYTWWKYFAFSVFGRRVKDKNARRHTPIYHHHLLQFSSSLNQLAIKLEEGRLQTIEPFSLVAHDLTLERLALCSSMQARNEKAPRMSGWRFPSQGTPQFRLSASARWSMTALCIQALCWWKNTSGTQADKK